jgi:hypothetical protein
MAEIDTLKIMHARIKAKATNELPMADIDGVDLSRSMLQQTVGKPPSGGSTVKGYLSDNINSEMIERCFQFISCPACVTEFSADTYDGITWDKHARLVEPMVVYEHLACHDPTASFIKTGIATLFY